MSTDTANGPGGITVVLDEPASGAQQRLWFLEQLVPGEPVHHLSAEFEVGDEVDAGLLTAAAADVVGRHEALRTVFRSEAGTLHQVVLSGLASSPVRPVTVAGGGMTWEACRRELASAPFDLATGPLLLIHPVRFGDRTRLVIVAHHLVVDGISFEILTRELTTAYAARRSGRAPDFDPLPVQYADFTAWQRSRMTSDEAVADLEFWQKALAGLPILDLTRGRPRPDELSHRGDEIVIPIDATQREALRRLAAARGGTLFMALVTLWSEAVGRWFGSADVPIGTSIAGRPLSEVAGVIGLFVDRVVLRMDTSGRPSFHQMLDRARDVVIGANDHTAVTFEQVVDAIKPDRVLGVTPLHQVGINLVPLSRLADGQFGNGTVRHDLNLDVLPLAAGLSARLEFRHGVVARSDAEGLADLFARLVTAALADPDQPLRDTPMIAEPGTLVRAGRPADPVDDSLTGLFLAQVAAVPEAPALVAGGTTMSYRDLAGAALALAGRLRAAGAGAEAPVLLATARRAELIVGMLGILAAGAAYVPVDPAAPERHLRHVTDASGATLAVAPAGVPLPLPDRIRVVDVDATARTSDAIDAPVTDPRQAAYLLFTSGTTGTPKGVVVEHRQVVAYTRAALAAVGAPSGASYLMVQPATFDSCVTQIYGALLTGGVLHLASEDLARDPDGLADYCAENRIDYLKIVPSHLSALLAGGRTELRPRRAAIVGGEASTTAFTLGLLRNGWSVVGHYGPTETTVGVLAHALTEPTLDGCATTPLGPPMTGVRAYVLDAEMEPVVPGTVGELYIGGALVARGYAGRPGRTAEVFRPDPFGRPGDRMYRTGDLVRERPDRTYEFLGRIDRQVKVGGHRIEPGAVEASLERHPGVRQAVTVVRGGRLVAYYVAAAGPAGAAGTAGPGVVSGTGPAPDEAELRTHVARDLPGGSVPSAFVQVEHLPQKSNGKLDADALPDPVVLASRTGAGEQPATATESRLCRVLAEVLDVAAISVTDNFFDLGGDSIRAIHVAARARTEGLTVSVRDIFAHQSVRALAAHVDAAAGSARDAARQYFVELLTPVKPAAGAGAAATSAATIPPDVRADLDGPAHAAYGTSGAELLTAAVAAASFAATGEHAVAALVDLGGDAVPTVVTPDDQNPASLIRAAKAALRAAADHRSDWSAVAGDPVLGRLRPAVSIGFEPTDPAGTGWIRVDGDRLVSDAPLAASAVAARLAELTRHCRGAGTSYAATDFPDAGLDDEQLGRLLTNLGVDQGER